MGDSIKKVGRKATGSALLGGPTTDQFKKATKKSSQISEKPFRKGTSATQREAKNQNLLQLQKEKAATAEAEGDIALRRGLAGSKVGRRSLIKSSPSGLARTLGGA